MAHPLQQKVILYDDVCPLCKAYTQGFVELGWLLPQHRIGFSNAPQALLDKIDLDRARHEIPLHDLTTGTTYYGKDALFEILGTAMPWLRPLFGWRVFRAVITGLYQIITYNRRIIAGSKAPGTGFDCAPDFHAGYRWLYIACAGLGALALFWSQKMPGGMLVLLVVAVLGGFLQKKFQQRTTYFGHFATVAGVAGLAGYCFGWSEWTTPIICGLSGLFLAKRTCT